MLLNWNLMSLIILMRLREWHSVRGHSENFGAYPRPLNELHWHYFFQFELNIWWHILVWWQQQWLHSCFNYFISNFWWRWLGSRFNYCGSWVELPQSPVHFCCLLSSDHPLITAGTHQVTQYTIQYIVIHESIIHNTQRQRHTIHERITKDTLNMTHKKHSDDMRAY